MGFHFLSNSGGKLNRAGHQGHFKKIVYWSHVARHIQPESIQTGNCLATARASVWIPFDRYFTSSHIRLIPCKIYVRFGTCCFTRSASFLVKNYNSLVISDFFGLCDLLRFTNICWLISNRWQALAFPRLFRYIHIMLTVCQNNS